MNSLVIYFSHVGENYMSDGIRNIEIGNTKIVADFISEITGADLFEVETKELYPYNYKECCDRAKFEFDNNIKPQLVNYLTDISNYDVIYIGGPIWYGTYPMALFSLIEKLDLSAKLIMPFSTHEGSKFGNAIKDLSKYAKGGTIKEGLSIRGSSAKDSKKILEKWCLI